MTDLNKWCYRSTMNLYSKYTLKEGRPCGSGLFFMIGRIGIVSNLIPDGYKDFIRQLKQRIQQAQVKAHVAVNRELSLLYWEIGRDLVAEQERRGWGNQMLRAIAADLQSAFPGTEGFSERNLYRMRAFFLAYPESLPQAVANLPWGHNAVLIQKLKDSDLRLWYAAKTLEHGWSRPILEMQIETKLFEREGKALTNFAQTLPSPQSDLAQQITRDPYSFDFLTLTKDAQERALERGLLEHLQKFMLELGAGFALVGNQYHLSVGDKDYYLDILLYHLKLRCFVVIDLKMGGFLPEYAGKMNFYLSVVDDLLRHPSDQPTIGLILCRGKDKLEVEYALRNVSSPIGIADFRYTEALPPELQSDLPTVEQLEAELERLEKE